MKVACLNNIAEIGLSTLSSSYQVITKVEEAQLILVRSFNMLEMDFNKDLLAVARAGAGVNNVPLEKLAKLGVVAFNTPGANANGVKELVLAGLFLASRDIVGGINFVKENKNDPEIGKTVEKAKAQFGGTEIFGKTIGVVGLGAVGGKVAKACHDLGMLVIGYDPYLSDEARAYLPKNIEIVHNLDDLYKVSDFMSLHLPLLDSTKKMFDKSVFAKCKKNLVILNFSRDLLVNDDDMEQAINEGIVKTYVTDFPNHQTANLKGVIAIPHLGASTEESEDNCAVMASRQLMKFIEEGSIINSVNYPNIDAGAKNTKGRILVLHTEKELVNGFMSVLSKGNYSSKLVNLMVKTNKHFGATIIDLDDLVKEDLIKSLEQVPGVIKVRII